jgi:hypothetical protein
VINARNRRNSRLREFLSLFNKEMWRAHSDHLHVRQEKFQMTLPADEIVLQQIFAKLWELLFHCFERRVSMFCFDRVIREVVHAYDMAYLSR